MTPAGGGPFLDTRAGLCGHCGHARVITSDRGSRFLQCHYATVDSSYPKYPRLPVLACAAYTERVEIDDDSGGSGR